MEAAVPAGQNRADDSVMKELFLLAEAHAHRVLSASEMETIDYWNSRLGFSPELIEFLINHCAAEGHTAVRYMDKVALSVAEAAQALGVSRPTMYEIIRRDDFDAAFKVGTRTLISRARFENWVLRQPERASK